MLFCASYAHLSCLLELEERAVYSGFKVSKPGQILVRIWRTARDCHRSLVDSNAQTQWHPYRETYPYSTHPPRIVLSDRIFVNCWDVDCSSRDCYEIMSWIFSPSHIIGKSRQKSAKVGKSRKMFQISIPPPLTISSLQSTDSTVKISWSMCPAPHQTGTTRGQLSHSCPFTVSRADSCPHPIGPLRPRVVQSEHVGAAHQPGQLEGGAGNSHSHAARWRILRGG